MNLGQKNLWLKDDLAFLDLSYNNHNCLSSRICLRFSFSFFKGSRNEGWEAGEAKAQRAQGSRNPCVRGLSLHQQRWFKATNYFVLSIEGVVKATSKVFAEFCFLDYLPRRCCLEIEPWMLEIGQSLFIPCAASNDPLISAFTGIHSAIIRRFWRD